MPATTMSTDEREREVAFQAMRREIYQYASTFTKRGECGCCVARALAFVAVDIGAESQTMPEVKDILMLLVDVIGDVALPAEH